MLYNHTNPDYALNNTIIYFKTTFGANQPYPVYLTNVRAKYNVQTSITR